MKKRDLVAVISFAHHKGGTGKTTSCLQVAGCLVKLGKKVLIVDTDPQANATLGLGIHPDTPGHNIYHFYLALSNQDVEPCSLADLIIRTGSGIDLIPSHVDLVGAEPLLYQIPDRYEILSREIAPLKRRYDYILIDTPPFLGQFVLNGIIAADKNILVFSPDSFAMNGYENIRLILSDIEEILGKQVTVDMAILNRWTQNEDSGTLTGKIHAFMKKFTNQTDTTQAEIESGLEERIRKDIGKVFIIPESRNISLSNRNGMPLIFTNPDDPAVKSFMTVAESIEQR